MIKWNTDEKDSEALRVPAKRKADDQHSDAEKKFLKGELVLFSQDICFHKTDFC